MDRSGAPGMQVIADFCDSIEVTELKLLTTLDASQRPSEPFGKSRP